MLAGLIFLPMGLRKFISFYFLTSAECPSSWVYGHFHHLQSQKQQVKSFSQCITQKTPVIYMKLYQDSLSYLRSTEKQAQFHVHS
jgi:hypothetical protein